ncbi:hypothetical protein [Leptospira alexanderi]|uniref:Integrase core domain protein n=1 Tax=Leptospira alexanderi serovar Manhao 3 str. L 60 TaxID=1049759 RepID=V6HXG0_9LEPT|nr:hypothetical protein [Leptospira alexanderi]EQA62196.1 hypothetical protein LEP1GSC062_0026 [Leptospira alexanderi serovar Manhao 3 str. L 60]
MDSGLPVITSYSIHYTKLYESLIQKLSEWIQIYNQERPNRAGRYLLTPLEIYEGKSVDSNLLKEQSKSAKNKDTRKTELHPAVFVS